MTQPVNDPPAPVAPAPRRRVPVGAIVLIVVGAALCLLALLPTVAGGFLVWAHATQRDSDGYFTTSPNGSRRLRYAVTSDDVDLGSTTGGRAPTSVTWPGCGCGSIGGGAAGVGGMTQRRGRPIPPRQGVARSRRVDATRSGRLPLRNGGPPDGARRPAVLVGPGRGDRSPDARWDLESGAWSVVVMNADGSPGVAVDASAGRGVVGAPASALGSWSAACSSWPHRGGDARGRHRRAGSATPTARPGRTATRPDLDRSASGPAARAAEPRGCGW